MMDKTLRTMHLRLDSTSRSLTKNALAQIIVKILYKNSGSVSVQELQDEIKKIFKAEISNDKIEASLKKLLEQDEIKEDKKKYKLTKANRKTIKNRAQELDDKIKRIVENYFSPFHSEMQLIIDWLSDSLMEFFRLYSKEWTFDICYNSRSEAKSKVKSKVEDIVEHIKRRTKNNKELDEKDKEQLVNKFVNLITSKADSDIDSILWQYGTSCFAANLLQASVGADQTSLEAFKGAKCVLDTNVLITIGMDASDNFESIKKLDSVFEELKISSGYLKITEDEYVNTVLYNREQVLRIVESFDMKIVAETQNDFIQSAIKRGCFKLDDFERYFDEIQSPPNILNENHSISLFDNSVELEKAINKAQKDDKKLDQLNSIFKKATGNSKREGPLIHDVGLIAGVEYIREHEKAVIISQEVSVNEYSHKKPLVNNLPVSIRIETLINILAIDNGGTSVNPVEFSSLFANIIRYNLSPKKESFTLADLSFILDTELNIEKLPASEVMRIANETHESLVQGLSEEDISLKLSREFQEQKVKFINELGYTKEELKYQQGENKKNKKQAEKALVALREQYKEEEISRVESKVVMEKFIYFALAPLMLLLVVIFGVYYSYEDKEAPLNNYIIGIATTVAVSVLSSLFITKPLIFRKKRKLLAEVELNVEDRINKKMNN